MGLQVEHIFKHSFLTAFHIIDMLYLGFLLRILWSSQSGHHSQNSLAKLGYILDMKVGKKNPSIFSDLHHNLLIKIWWFEKKSLQNLINLGHFFPWEILCIGWNHIVKKHSCTGALLTFHKPGPMSLIQYFLMASRKLFIVNKSMLN